MENNIYIYYIYLYHVIFHILRIWGDLGTVKIIFYGLLTPNIFKCMMRTTNRSSIKRTNYFSGLWYISPSSIYNIIPEPPSSFDYYYCINLLSTFCPCYFHFPIFFLCHAWRQLHTSGWNFVSVLSVCPCPCLVLLIEDGRGCGQTDETDKINGKCAQRKRN